MTTNINEAVAKKMRWVLKEGLLGWYWSYDDMPKELTLGNVIMKNELPPFSTDWNATKIVIRWMRERGMEYFVLAGFDSGTKYLNWLGAKSGTHYKVLIENDDLPLAACEAFLLIPDKDLEVKGV